MARVEVITGTARRRTYTEEQKLALLATAFSPGVCVRDVIRRHDIPASSLYKWRQQYGVALQHVAPAYQPATTVAASPIACRSTKIIRSHFPPVAPNRTESPII